MVVVGRTYLFLTNIYGNRNFNISPLLFHDPNLKRKSKLAKDKQKLLKLKQEKLKTKSTSSKNKYSSFIKNLPINWDAIADPEWKNSIRKRCLNNLPEVKELEALNLKNNIEEQTNLSNDDKFSFLKNTEDLWLKERDFQSRKLVTWIYERKFLAKDALSQLKLHFPNLYNNLSNFVYCQNKQPVENTAEGREEALKNQDEEDEDPSSLIPFNLPIVLKGSPETPPLKDYQSPDVYYSNYDHEILSKLNINLSQYSSTGPINRAKTNVMDALKYKQHSSFKRTKNLKSKTKQ